MTCETGLLKRQRKKKILQLHTLSVKRKKITDWKITGLSNRGEEKKINQKKLRVTICDKRYQVNRRKRAISPATQRLSKRRPQQQRQQQHYQTEWSAAQQPYKVTQPPWLKHSHTIHSPKIGCMKSGKRATTAPATWWSHMQE